MLIKKNTYKYNLEQEEPPIGLTLQELQKKMFANETDMNNHSQEIVTDLKKLWNVYRSLAFPK